MPFQPGNKLAVGHAAPPLRKFQSNRRRFLSQSLVSQLNETDRNNVSKFHKIASRMIEAALDGDSLMIKEIFDRVEGKAVQAVELSGPDGSAISTIATGMTPAEAARLYASTIGSEEANDGDVIDAEFSDVESAPSAPEPGAVAPGRLRRGVRPKTKKGKAAP